MLQQAQEPGTADQARLGWGEEERGSLHPNGWFLSFLGPHLKHTKVPRLEVESQLLLLAYTTATATPGPVCDLHHCSRPCQSLHPLVKATDRTCILMDTRWVLSLLSPHGNSPSRFYIEERDERWGNRVIFPREESAPVWKEAMVVLCLQGASFVDCPCSIPRPPTPKKCPCPDPWPLSSHLVVELPPAPETQLQELVCVLLDDLEAHPAKKNPELRG